MTESHFAVTGVATGIGAELARQLIASGARVTGFDIAPPAHADYPCHRIDLADLGSIESTVAACSGAFDGLCNNAGLSPKPGRELAILQVNFFAQRAFTRAMLPKLRPGAAIVNMASRAGARWRDHIEQIKRLSAIDPTKDLARFIRDEGIDMTRAYNLSKEALIVWTLAEAEALTARNLRMNALCPAAVATGLLDDFAKAFGEPMAKNIARAGRPGQPEEIAAIAAFLLFPASNWLRGAEISPDGGMAAFATSDALDLAGLRLDPVAA